MDEVFAGFREAQQADAEALNERSPLVKIHRHGAAEEATWLVDYRCRGLVRTPDGTIEEAEHFQVGIRFPEDYLGQANPYVVASWLGPRAAYHPNIGIPPGFDRPYICVGHLRPGTPLIDLVLQAFEIISYQKVTMNEGDAINQDACRWARANLHRFPIDRRSILGREVYPAPSAQIEGHS